MSITKLSAKQLRRAAALREKMDKLEKQLAAILSVSEEAPITVRKGGRRRKKAVVSAPAAKPRRKMSKAARAKMSAAAKKRWALAKAAGKKSL